MQLNEKVEAPFFQDHCLEIHLSIQGSHSCPSHWVKSEVTVTAHLLFWNWVHFLLFLLSYVTSQQENKSLGCICSFPGEVRAKFQLLFQGLLLIQSHMCASSLRLRTQVIPWRSW